MLVLFETAAGYAIFKVLDENKLHECQDLYNEFQDPDSATQIVDLKHFRAFDGIQDALQGAAALIETKMSKGLKKLLKKVYSSGIQDELAVADVKLGNMIKEKMGIPCIHSSGVQELMRGIRSQITSLLGKSSEKEAAAMSIGLAHSLSRYKLKFSPDKIDTMIIQAISLLDDLDKEINNYIMRAREWYGWHFPELGKIITDHLAYVKLVKKIGFRTNTSSLQLNDILPEDLEAEVKKAAEVSMGTDVSEEDILNINHLCDEVIEMSHYRTELHEYVKNRMMMIAPNLTVLVGELVGARLISHAGSLMSLAKHPASTVQILGAEKALFRALKMKHDTPKYGLLYHASLVGQSNPKNKGKVSRMLAAKAALAVRVDALKETDLTPELGIQHRANLESRLRMLEEQGQRRISGTGKQRAKYDKYQHKSEIRTYDTSADSTLPQVPIKRKFDEPDEIAAAPSSPKRKKAKIEEVTAESTPASPPKKKKIKVEKLTDESAPVFPPMKKKKTKLEHDTSPTRTIEHDDSVAQESVETSVNAAEETPKEKKKKKKKCKSLPEADEAVPTEAEAVEEVKAEASSPKKKKKKKKKEGDV